jgi:hypothetical protein
MSSTLLLALKYYKTDKVKKWINSEKKVIKSYIKTNNVNTTK